MVGMRKILAVDDNPLNLEILKEIIGDRFRLSCVTSGVDALRVAKEVQPDIVLLDVMMPGMDGLTTCRELRRIQELQHSRIVMVSAKALPSERQAGLAAGANEYISKPFDESELLRAVESD